LETHPLISYPVLETLTENLRCYTEGTLKYFDGIKMNEIP
jgi:hypothetical protein